MAKPAMETPKPSAETGTPADAGTPTAGEPGTTPKGATSAMQELQQFIEDSAIDTSRQDWRIRLPKPPQADFDAQATYTWSLKTSEGPIEVRLLPKTAPMHVSSTIFLTELGFYDGLVFHRIIPGFMAQGGDPEGNGRGGPGYKYAGELDPSVRHSKPGLLSMANAGPGTDGSQFFLTFVPTPHLDGKHTIFGEVVSGMDTLKKIEQQGSQSGAPKKPVTIETATIRVE
jgi:cyclophilin family peptidyl-prolyl cis-trans isomerase